MPVKFKGSSEYDRKFKWHDSYLSHSHQVDDQEAAFAAGLISVNQGNVREPALQRKGRSASELSQEKTSNDAPVDDYILLGDQSKFAPSIKYHTKARRVPTQRNGIANGVGNGSAATTEKSPPPAPRPVDPPPKVVVNTGASKLGGQGQRKLQDESIQVGKPIVGGKKQNVEKSSHPAPPPKVNVDTGAPKVKPPSGKSIHEQQIERKSKQHRYRNKGQAIEFRDEGTQVGKPTVSKLRVPNNQDVEGKRMMDSGVQVNEAIMANTWQLRDRLERTESSGKIHTDPSHKKQSAIKKSKMSDEKLGASSKSTPAGPAQSKSVPVHSDRKDKRTGSMNEFVQTDLDKGVADSGQEAGADYGMRYRAGIAPPRRTGPQRKSEYQMQFRWKNPVLSSPLLAAEQMVYKSSTSLTPAKDPVAKVSEYQKQFKPWKMIPVTPDSLGTPAGDIAAPSKNVSMQRSKSLEEIASEKVQAAGIKRVTSAGDKRLLKGSQNPVKLHFPHGKFKNYSSEYAANFKPPSKFAYEAGAWKGADPPHMQPQKTAKTEPVKEPVVEDAASSVTSASTTNWYAEVTELRQKADEYKRRAHGTHFSREHLVQLYARQAELWDTVSNSSVLSALSLEEPGKAKKRSKSKKSSSSQASSSRQSSPKQGVEKVKKYPLHPSESEDVSRKLAWPAEDDEDIFPSASRSSRSSSVASLRTHSVHSAGSGHVDSDDDHTLIDDQEGRVPTPELQVSPTYRHHLDRTTPAVGGALLTSPPKQDQASSISSSSVRMPKKGRSQPVSGKYSKVNSIAGQEPHVSQSAPAVMTPQQKGSGNSKRKPSPTYGMPTRDTHVMLDEDSSADRPLQTSFVSSPLSYRTASRRDEFLQRHPGVDHLSTIQEGTGSSFGRGSGLVDDDDVMSVSMQSVASSCSLASEVLDRARQRRDEFWGRPSKIGGRA